MCHPVLGRFANGEFGKGLNEAGVVSLKPLPQNLLGGAKGNTE